MSEDAVILKVQLRSGRFDAHVEIPLSLPKEQREKLIASWLKMLESAVVCGEEIARRNSKTQKTTQ